MNYFKSSYFIFIFVVIRTCYGDEDNSVIFKSYNDIKIVRNPEIAILLKEFLCNLPQMTYYIGGAMRYAQNPLEIRTYQNGNRHHFDITKSAQTQPEVSFWDTDVESVLHYHEAKIRLNLRNNSSTQILKTLIISYYDKNWAQYFYQVAVTDSARGQELAYGATILKTYNLYEYKLVSSTANVATNMQIFVKDTTGDGSAETGHMLHTASVRSYSLVTSAGQGVNPKPQLIFSSKKFRICSEVKDNNKVLIILTEIPNLIFVIHFDEVNGQPQQFFDLLKGDQDDNTPMISDQVVSDILDVYS